MQIFLTNCLFRNLALKSTFRRTVLCVRNYSTNDENPKTFPQPKFSTSGAYRGGRFATPVHLHPYLSKVDVYPRRFMMFQQFVIFVSLGCLFWYMLIREESDFDEMFDLDKPLWKSVPALELQVLNEQIMFAKHRGDPPEVILEYEKRVEEIERELKLHQIDEKEKKKKLAQK